MKSYPVCFVSIFLSAIVLVELACPADDDGEKQSIPKVLQEELKGAVTLNPEKTVYVHAKKKHVDLLTIVNLRDGLLEMLCCPKGTKEHESVLVIDSKSYIVHTALLSIGAEPGKPVRYDPEYIPPQGEQLQITALWVNEQGELQKSDVRQWIRTATRRYFGVELKSLPDNYTFPEDSELKYDSVNQELFYYGVMPVSEYEKLRQLSSGKTYRSRLKQLFESTQPSGMEADWVFVGSGVVQDPQTEKNLYLAEAGDLICVANFPSATIDISIKSSSSDANRGYEANPKAIPELGTPVILRIQRVEDVKTGKTTNG